MCFDRCLRLWARFLRWPASLLLPLSTSAALACSTMVLGLPERPIIAYSFDFAATGAGFLFVSPTGATRRSIMDGPPAEWQVRYGSVTFNQIGPGMPTAGMNTAGLVVSLMWNNDVIYNREGRAPIVNELEFIQLLLDSAGSVDEALEALQQVRILGMVPIHYLLADSFGNTATVTPTSTKLLVHTGDEMPVTALTNTNYAKLLERIGAFEGFGGEKEIPSAETSKDPNSFERFMAAAKATRRADPALTTVKAFDALVHVANSETRWQIVFDPLAQQIAFRIVDREDVHLIDMSRLDFGCLKHPLSAELSEISGKDFTEALKPIDPIRADSVARSVFSAFRAGPDIADGLTEGLLDALTCNA